MLLREGPAQKAFCEMSPNLASRRRGGRGDGGKRVQENGASLQAMNVLPAITHNQENKESVFSKKPGGRVFFMDLGKRSRVKSGKHNQKAPEDVTDWKCENRAFTSNPRRC